jgi:probable phosphoglycerate mutase
VTVGRKFLEAESRGLDFLPPGGESPRMVMQRIADWTAEIARTGLPVVAVSHKAAIRALLALATGWDMTGRQPVKLDWRALHFFAVHDDGRVTLDRPNVALVPEKAGAA